MILIDAYSQIFRCYHAVRHLNNSRGEPTNALLPFTRLLLKLQHDFPEDRGAMVFDCGRVQFRLELNADYKANRPPMPEDLKQQIPVLRELAAAFGWPLLEEPEYEADDLIAALARAATEPVRIVSSDKDLAQLVDQRIALLLPGKNGAGWELRDSAGVLEKFAVPPAAIVDYLALLGDAADNIPGVPGVGPKTAAEWLRIAPLDDLLAAPEKIANPRQRARLLESVEILERNRKLIRLRSDLPERLLPITESCARRAPDWETITGICERMELHSLLRQLPRTEHPSRANDDLPLFAATAAPAPEPAKPIQGDLFENL